MTHDFVSNHTTNQLTNRKWGILPSGTVQEIKEIQTGQGLRITFPSFAKHVQSTVKHFSGKFSHYVQEACFNEHHLMYYKTTSIRILKSAHLRPCWSTKSHPSCTLRCSYIAMALKDLILSFGYWTIILLSAKIIKKKLGKDLNTRSRQCRTCMFSKRNYSHIQLREGHCIV